MMSDNDKPETAQVENTRSTPRRRGCLGHCRKFWWAYLIVAAIVAVVVVILM